MTCRCTNIPAAVILSEWHMVYFHKKSLNGGQELKMLMKPIQSLRVISLHQGRSMMIEVDKVANFS